MTVLSENHKELKNGKGKCSVPMWRYPGVPAGFCCKDAYGFRPEGKTYRRAYDGQIARLDGCYAGHVPGLACSAHGGPTLKELAHQGDPCKYCGIPHDEVEIGPCRARQQEWI